MSKFTRNPRDKRKGMMTKEEYNRYEEGLRGMRGKILKIFGLEERGRWTRRDRSYDSDSRAGRTSGY